jgi:hypothetical protein
MLSSRRSARLHIMFVLEGIRGQIDHECLNDVPKVVFIGCIGSCGTAAALPAAGRQLRPLPLLARGGHRIAITLST